MPGTGRVARYPYALTPSWDGTLDLSHSQQQANQSLLEFYSAYQFTSADIPDHQT